MPNTNLLDAEFIAERIRQKISEHDFGEFKVTTSIGVSIYQADDEKLSDLVFLADEALYQAKENGKNRIVTSKSADRLGGKIGGE